MLSHLKNYLFGGTGDLVQEEVQDGASNVNNCSTDDDWVLVDCKGDTADDDAKDSSISVFDESWIVTKHLALKTVIASRGNKSRKTARQPKGTKPRRWKGRKLSNCVAGPKQEDTESTSSSIAVVPAPARSAATSAAASAILAASNDAKQLAAISSARTAQLKSEKNWISRKGMMRGNKVITATKRSAKRSNLMGSRPCGSNNNRKTHKTNSY